MFKGRVCYYFMPHGLGHLVGLEVHDVGGYLSFTPGRDPRKGIDKLRTARILAKGNVISVEPGIYFRENLLKQAFKDKEIEKYFNKEKLMNYFDFGGVRIEDNVVVQAEGQACINLTKDIPRETADIEKAMADK